MMNIPWKLKSRIFGFIDLFNLPSVLYLLQRYVTRRAVINITDIPGNWTLHKHALKDLDKPKLFEFGAGKNLGQNLFLSQICDEQVVVDLNPMADLNQINDSARQIAALSKDIDHKPVQSFDDLKNNYGIDYRAPYDAAKTDFEDGYFDCCVSTNTLEHIPYESIKDIFIELKRIVKKGGLISARIDYSDHYAHTDQSIGLLNYLSFTEDEWEKYNHQCHYQNRLRQYDYERLFEELGFEIVRNEPNYIDHLTPPANIADGFEKDNPALLAVHGYFLLRNK